MAVGLFDFVFVRFVLAVLVFAVRCCLVWHIWQFWLVVCFVLWFHECRFGGGLLLVVCDFVCGGFVCVVVLLWVCMFGCLFGFNAVFELVCW